MFACLIQAVVVGCPEAGHTGEVKWKVQQCIGRLYHSCIVCGVTGSQRIAEKRRINRRVLCRNMLINHCIL